jgi:hypothetical protein
LYTSNGKSKFAVKKNIKAKPNEEVAYISIRTSSIRISFEKLMALHYRACLNKRGITVSAKKDK